MPATSTPLRALAGSIVGMLLLTGCQTIDNANQVISRADLVNELASRLDRSAELTYSADYQLPGGETASIMQAPDPPRATYSYPGGRLTVSAEATTECDTTNSKPSCTMTLPPSPANRPTAAVFAEANERGLVTPPVVINLLTAAALDADALIEQSDTTVAGRHASCVQVKGVTNAAASSFDACITTEGVLGSFTGVIDGSPVDIVLTGYRETVEKTAFDVPSGAGVVDQRPAAS